MILVSLVSLIFNTINDKTSNNVEQEGFIVNTLMYADDLIVLAHTEEELQEKINALLVYCRQWKLEINVQKTKMMIFNRGNKLMKGNCMIGNEYIESVKTVKYLGFWINSKNCSFLPTVDDLSTRANRAIFALNNKIK